MKKVFFLISLAFVVCSLAFAEQITITTYYPAPYGVYKDLEAETLTVNNNDQIVWIGDGSNPGIKLLGDSSAKKPYISFDNDGTGADDYAITLKGDNALWMSGGTTTFADDSDNPAVIKVKEVWYCPSY